MDSESAGNDQVSSHERPQDHHVSFFKPVSPYGLANMKVIIIMVIVWAVGVFGFQFALIALGKPTPEVTLDEFKAAWPVVQRADADTASRQQFARSMLMVLGKNTSLKDDDRGLLKEALSWSVYGQLDDTAAAVLDGHVAALAALDAGESPDPEAVAGHREQIRTLAGEGLGLADEGFDRLMAALLPWSLVSRADAGFGEADREALPAVMDKYLIHSQSVLTDFKFLGFPFHYWYTAQFLLIMFVGLCAVYAVVTDRLHRRYGLTDE